MAQGSVRPHFVFETQAYPQQEDLLLITRWKGEEGLSQPFRFELELALMNGDLEAADLPEAWDAATDRILGVRAPGPAQGVLQDVHWSAGLFGYFPSYTIGNLYAASFRYTMESDLPAMWTDVQNGRFEDVLGWLRTNVHDRGHVRDAPELFKEAVGDRDPVADLMAHLRSRHGALYGVS